LSAIIQSANERSVFSALVESDELMLIPCMEERETLKDTGSVFHHLASAPIILDFAPRNFCAKCSVLPVAQNFEKCAKSAQESENLNKLMSSSYRLILHI